MCCWDEIYNKYHEDTYFLIDITCMWNTFSVFFGCEETNKIGDDVAVKDQINGYLNDTFNGVDISEDRLKEILDSKEYKKWILNKKSQIPEVENNADAMGDFFQKIKNYLKSFLGDENHAERSMYEAIKANDTDDYHFFYEIIQNADDCEYQEKDKQFEVSKVSENKILFKYNEIGMKRSDVIALCSLYDSNKNKNQGNTVTEKEEETDKQQIGEKGQGFKTVFKVAEQVEIKSGIYHFTIKAESTAPDKVKLETKAWTDKESKVIKEYEGTQILLTLWKEEKDFHKGYNTDIVLKEMQKRYFGFDKDVKDGCDANSKKAIFTKCPILFTQNIRFLKIGDNELKISESGDGENLTKGNICYGNKEMLKFFRYKEKITFGEKECESRYGKGKYKEIKKDIQIIVPYSISEESIRIDDIKGQMYSFLPTEIGINVPMDIHIPAFLEENREDIKSENNKQSTVKWNELIIERLFGASSSENVGVINGVIQNFLEIICKKIPEEEVIKLIPAEHDDLFDKNSVITNILNKESLKASKDNCFRRAKIFSVQSENEGEYVNGSDAFVFDSNCFEELGIEKIYFSDLQQKLESLSNKQLIRYVNEIKKIKGKCGFSDPEKSKLKDMLLDMLNNIYKNKQYIDELWKGEDVASLKILKLLQSSSDYLPCPEERFKLNIFPFYKNSTEIEYGCYKEGAIWIIPDREGREDLSSLLYVKLWAGKDIRENIKELLKQNKLPIMIKKIEFENSKVKNLKEFLYKQEYDETKNSFNYTPYKENEDIRIVQEILCYLAKRLGKNEENWYSFVTTTLNAHEELEDKDKKEIMKVINNLSINFSEETK